MKASLLALSLLAVFAVHQAQAASLPVEDEASRERAVSEALANHDTEAFMNAATPAEIAEVFGMEYDAADYSMQSQVAGDSEDGSDASNAISSTGPAIDIAIHLDSHSITMTSADPRYPSLRAGAIGGRPGHGTPAGCFRAIGQERLHYSHKYGMTPMPNSTFFIPGIAIHTGPLAIPSHGCVHVADSTSAAVFAAVAAHRDSNRICVYHN